MFIDVIIQTNLHVQIFIKFYNAMYQISNLLVFSLVASVIQKVQKVENVNIQSDCETTCKKRTDSSSVFTRGGKVRKRGER